MNFSNSDNALGQRRRGDVDSQQATERTPHAVLPVDAELNLREVALAILGELDSVVHVCQRGVDVADEHVDCTELLLEHVGLAAAGDRAVVDRANRGGHGEALQPVRDDGQQHAQSRWDERLHRLLGERPSRQARQVCAAVLSGLHRNDEGNLFLRAAARRTTAAFPAEIGFVDLDAAGGLPGGFGLRQAVQQLVRNELSGGIAQARLKGQLQSRDVVLGLGEQLRDQEPANQRQSGGFEIGATGHAALALAAGTRPVKASLAPELGARLDHASDPAIEAAGPARGYQQLLALFLGFVAAHDDRERRPLLKLASVIQHGASRWGAPILDTK